MTNREMKEQLQENIDRIMTILLKKKDVELRMCADGIRIYEVDKRKLL